MGEDTSLDEFLDANEDETHRRRNDKRSEDGAAVQSEPVGEGSDETTEEFSEKDTAPTEPVSATYDSAPDGSKCAACEEVVDRRWRDEPGFVCESCKDW